MSENSDPFELKGKIDAYSDEYADDLLDKLNKQTRDIMGGGDADFNQEKDGPITLKQTSSVPVLPPVIHKTSDKPLIVKMSKRKSVVPLSAKAKH